MERVSAKSKETHSDPNRVKLSEKEKSPNAKVEEESKEESKVDRSKSNKQKTMKRGGQGA